ncbi:hypothetical protein ACFVFI_27615 [Streptomyces sp. NPDC057705]|uniref:hypothetical protein n=1 Tax=Streptomyces sp. NPDC057705 TaxID=3346222 RepID=UPI00367D4674
MGEGGVLVEWDWWTVDFGEAHAGAVGVLVSGSEPGPVYFDVGSGSDVPSTTHWSAYDGRARRPRADALRAACACGWRGAAEYPLDWDVIGDRPLYEADIDLTGPLVDWNAHLSLVRDKAVPLPEPLGALLVDMAEQLTATAAEAPLAALCDDGLSAEAVGTALGITRSETLVLLLTAQDR